MNHRVHLFSSGCLTLKFSLSWKTVTTLPSASFVSEAPPEGEMGMVERSTCWSMLAAAGAGGEADAMVDACAKVTRCGVMDSHPVETGMM